MTNCFCDKCGHVHQIRPGSQTPVRRVVPNLRTVREGFGLSQQELADVAGVARNTIVNLENGRGANASTQNKLMTVVRTLRVNERAAQPSIRSIE